MAEVKSRYPNGSQMTASGEKVPDRNLDALRAKIARLEGPPARHFLKTGSEAGSKDGGGAPPRRPVLPLGVKAIDGYLPWGGLPAGALHEVIAGDVSPAAIAFVLALLTSPAAAGGGRGGKGPAPFLWCVNGDVPYRPGLAAFGIEDRQLLVVRGRNDRDVLWAAEEGLGAGGPGGGFGRNPHPRSHRVAPPGAGGAGKRRDRLRAPPLRHRPGGDGGAHPLAGDERAKPGRGK